VPASLSAITMRAMARDPAQRYRSARQMSQALKQWVDTEAEVGGDDGTPRAFTKRRLVIATLLAGVGIGAVVGWHLLGSADENHSAAVAIAAPARKPAGTIPPAEPTAAVANGTASAGETLTNLPADAPAEPAQAAVPALPQSRPAERPLTRERSARDARSSAAAATGVVQLAVAPWGQIEVDGKGAGVTPPLSHLTLSVGEHVITVRNADFVPHTVKVRVSADQPVVVRHRFGS
jgi:serine/threonine-protein kinase